MKMLFHPPNIGNNLTSGTLEQRVPVPHARGGSLAKYLAAVGSTTRNVGNLVHHEAIPKIFECDRVASSVANLEAIYVNQCKRDSDRFSEHLRQYNCIVLSFANIIRSSSNGFNYNFTLWCEIIRAIDCQLYVFGIGKQDNIDNHEKLPNDLLRFLELLNKKASIFGVRGKWTEKWCHENGFGNALAVGCPSLYQYPTNIFNISWQTKSNLKVASAGYLFKRNLTNENDLRMRFVKSISDKFEVSYVFQNDIYSYCELHNIHDLIDEATGMVSSDILSDYQKALGCGPLRIKDYWHFRSASSWRQFSCNRDLYFGDRFHCGVTSLQVGKPAVFVYDDLRVKEMCEFYALPKVSLGEVSERQDYIELLNEQLGKDSLELMKQTYLDRMNAFHQICDKHGISVVDREKQPIRRYRLEEVSPAIRGAEKIYKKDGGIGSLSLLVERYLEFGLLNRIKHVVCEFIESDIEHTFSEDDAHHLFRLSKNLDKSGLLREALYFNEGAISVKSDHQGYLIHYSRLLLDSGRGSDASRVLEGIDEIGDNEIAIKRLKRRALEVA